VNALLHLARPRGCVLAAAFFVPSRQGAYHPTKKHGVRDDTWSGPAVTFVDQVARRADFLMNITEPPEWVKAKANSTSTFTQCVFGLCPRIR
jgi:hypothetical protein